MVKRKRVKIKRVKLSPVQARALAIARQNQLLAQQARKRSLGERTRQETQGKFRVFGRVPNFGAPIFNKVTRRETGDPGRIDFLQGETFMYGNDLIPKETFIAKRLRDL